MKIRQHYVPKFYLKNFAIKKGPKTYMIQCFDKSNNKTFIANINDIAVEKYFYDKEEPTATENILSFLERESARVLRLISTET